MLALIKEKMLAVQWIHYCFLSILLIDGEAVYRGHLADEGQFKYIVSVKILGNQYCGGAIISENHILSAAHCYRDLTTTDVMVFANILGVRNPGTGVIIREVKKITPHGEHKPPEATASSCQESSEDPCLRDMPTNDIAILTLEESLQLMGNIDKVPYKPTDDPIIDCNECVFAGYGDYLRSPSTSLLRWTFFDILTPQECKDMNAQHRSNEFCAMDRDEITCLMKGDSGGPLVCKGIIVGIASTGVPNPSCPSTYADVSQHIDFIERVLKDSQVEIASTSVGVSGSHG